MDEFTFCVNAAGERHLRRLTQKGRTKKTDTPSLCGNVKSGKGTDILLPLVDKHLRESCRTCVGLFERVRGQRFQERP